MSSFNYDWSDLAFASKKPLRSLKPVFIAAPREISIARIKQLIKEYLPISSIIFGLAKEDYIDGFEDQPHFKTYKDNKEFRDLVNAVNSKNSSRKIYTLSYFQRELTYIVEKLAPNRLVFIRGSWHKMFHVNEIYYKLVNNNLSYELVSPFTDEQEAKEYLKKVEPKIKKRFWPKDPKGVLSAEEMINNAQSAAKFSFDYGFQTGVTLGKRVKNGYKHLLFGYNKVVPYQTYAMHYGASREANFSPPQDLNHYDTIHAEVHTILQAAEKKIDLSGTALFINLLPCPVCARMFAQTPIEEFVYSEDHSGGYTVKLLEKAGKKVRRVVL